MIKYIKLKQQQHSSSSQVKQSNCQNIFYMLCQSSKQSVNKEYTVYYQSNYYIFHPNLSVHSSIFS